MAGVLQGATPLVLLCAFVAGLVAFGFGADRLDSERSARVSIYKACADALTAGVAEGKLPDICKGVKDEPAKVTGAAKEAKAVEALGALYRGCVDVAVAQGRPAAMCEEIRARIGR